MGNNAFSSLVGIWQLSSHEEKFTITFLGDKTYHSDYIIKGDGGVTKTNGVFEIVDVGTVDQLRLLVLYNPTDKIKTIYEVREISDHILRLTLDEEEEILTLKKN